MIVRYIVTISRSRVSINVTRSGHFVERQIWFPEHHFEWLYLPDLLARPRSHIRSRSSQVKIFSTQNCVGLLPANGRLVFHWKVYVVNLNSDPYLNILSQANQFYIHMYKSLCLLYHSFHRGLHKLKFTVQFMIK